MKETVRVCQKLKAGKRVSGKDTDVSSQWVFTVYVADRRRTRGRQVAIRYLGSHTVTCRPEWAVARLVRGARHEDARTPRSRRSTL